MRMYYDPDPNLSRMSLNIIKHCKIYIQFEQSYQKEKHKSQYTSCTNYNQRNDFTTTVDEINSLVILLPDDDGNASGEIVVTNDGGSVTLNETYQVSQ